MEISRAGIGIDPGIGIGRTTTERVSGIETGIGQETGLGQGHASEIGRGPASETGEIVIEIGTAVTVIVIGTATGTATVTEIEIGREVVIGITEGVAEKDRGAGVGVGAVVEVTTIPPTTAISVALYKRPGYVILCVPLAFSGGPKIPLGVLMSRWPSQNNHFDFFPLNQRVIRELRTRLFDDTF